MPTEADLLAAIDADPDADAPRLAHADWLEARGHTRRAAFIRDHLAGRGGGERVWTESLPQVPGMDWRCRRGYPEVVRFGSLTAFKKGWRLTAGHRVRHVEFAHVRNAARLADEPALASIASLDLAWLDFDDILAILRSPHVGALRHLAVRPRPAGPEALGPLAALPAFARLLSLHIDLFSSVSVPEAAAAALAGSPHLAGLRDLRLTCWLDEGGMAALFRPAALTALTALALAPTNVRNNATTQGGLAGLGDGAALPGLERFTFLHKRTEPDPGLAIAGARRWTRLRSLDLTEANVRDAGAAALAVAAHLSRLERLGLRNCRVSDAGAVALADSPHLGALASLDLTSNVIGRAGVAALGRSGRLTSLHALSLTFNPAPGPFIEAVTARFRDGGPPVQEEAPPPAVVVEAPSAPMIGVADEDGLVRAIWADPFDEVPRLVYADWLEEQGRPLHAAILRSPPGERKALASRLDAELRADTPWPFQCWVTPEGLIRVSIPVRSLRSKGFERYGPAWLRRHHVAEVAPDGTPSDWAALFAAGWLANTRGLSFTGRPGDSTSSLGGSPHLASLSSLDLSRSFMSRVDELFKPSGLRGVCRLLFGTYVHQNSLQTMCEAPFAANLRHLGLGRLSNAPAMMAVLGAAPALAGLVTLGLHGAHLGDTAVKALADATTLASLRNLDISESWFGDVGLEGLAASPLVPRLRWLRLTPRNLSAAALERLARALPPRCRLALAGETEAAKRDAVAAVLGDRLIMG